MAVASAWLSLTGMSCNCTHNDAEHPLARASAGADALIYFRCSQELAYCTSIPGSGRKLNGSVKIKQLFTSSSITFS